VSATAPALRRFLATAVASVVLALACVLFSPSVAVALVPGDFDPSFGAGGDVFYPWGSGAAPASKVNAVAVEPDGKIILGGFATDTKGNNAFLVARLDPDGSLDPLFGNGGRVLVQLGTGSYIYSGANALAIQPDGKILVGGNASSDEPGFPTDESLVARLNADGSFDPAFGDDGTVELGRRTTSDGDTLDPGPVAAIAQQGDGKIVVGGGAGWGDCCSAALVGRLTSDGSLDASFGDGGIVKVWKGTNAGRHAGWGGEALALQPDGKIVLGGFGPDNPDGWRSGALVVRLSSTGSLDSSFGDGGMVSYEPFPNDDGHGAEANGLVLQPDGKIVIAGDASGSDHPDSRILVARISGKDGSLDPSFAGGGVLLARLGAGASPGASAQTLALQPNGTIILGGYATDSSSKNEALVARLGPDGSFDSSFGNAGKVLGPPDGGGSEVHALTIQPDNKIVAAGLISADALISRLIGEPPSVPQPGPPGGGSGPALTPLVAALSRLRMSHSVFAAASRGGSIARSIGTTVSYTDSAASTTMFTVLKPARGIKRRHSCVKPSHGKTGKHCTRYVAVGFFTHSDLAGFNSFHFTGRVNHRKLRPGHYQLRARPRFGDPKRKAVTTTFRIVR
jgi:uncharacterized delta-60 repeat protein